MLASSLCLHESLLQDLEAQTVALDIHLCCCQAVLCTGGLEVHVAQVVLVAKDVAKHSILLLAGVLDQTHSDAADGLLHRYTSVHEGECAGTYGSH